MRQSETRGGRAIEWTKVKNPLVIFLRNWNWKINLIVEIQVNKAIYIEENSAYEIENFPHSISTDGNFST